VHAHGVNLEPDVHGRLFPGEPWRHVGLWTGLYLADSRDEAAGYGQWVVRFEFEPNTNYMVAHGPQGTQHATAVGVPLQRLLAEPQLYALLKVTAHYSVMRTPFNCVVGPC